MIMTLPAPVFQLLARCSLLLYCSVACAACTVGTPDIILGDMNIDCTLDENDIPAWFLGMRNEFHYTFVEFAQYGQPRPVERGSPDGQPLDVDALEWFLDKLSLGSVSSGAPASNGPGAPAAYSGASAPSSPARFWLSDSPTDPGSLDSPTFQLNTAAPTTLYIWGRPMPGKRLRNLSLNVVADGSGVEFADGSYSVFNDLGDGLRRFEMTHDSFVTDYPTSELRRTGPNGFYDDALYGLMGVTVRDTLQTIGVGPSCHANDLFCNPGQSTASDDDAWLIASFDVTVSASNSGETPVYLQVGEAGMRHVDWIAGDFNEDGEVDQADYSAWADSYCPGGSCEGAMAGDANSDSAVDSADYTIWRDNVGATGGGLEESLATSVAFAGNDQAYIAGLHGVFNPSCQATNNRSCNFFAEAPHATLTWAFRATPTQSVPEPSAASLAVGLIFAASRGGGARGSGRANR